MIPNVTIRNLSTRLHAGILNALRCCKDKYTLTLPPYNLMLQCVLKRTSALPVQERWHNPPPTPLPLEESIWCSSLLIHHVHFGQVLSTLHWPSGISYLHPQPHSSVKAQTILPSLSERFFSSFSHAEVCAPSVACRFSICRRRGRVAEVTLWLSSWFLLSASWSLWNHKLNIIKIKWWTEGLIQNSSK